MLELLLHVRNAFHGEGIEMVLGDEDKEKDLTLESESRQSHSKNRKVLRVQLQ